MSLGGLVLAAGEGRRMGGPKVLLLVGGAPLVAAHVARLFEAGCSRVLVLVPPGLVARVALVCGRAEVLGVSTASQAQTLAAGAKVLRGLERLVIAPVDMVPAALRTVRSLVDAVDDLQVWAATPRYRGEGGHPVVLRTRALAPYLDASAAPPPLQVCLGALGPQRVRVDVEDPAVRGDLDTPAEFQRAIAQDPSFLG